MQNQELMEYISGIIKSVCRFSSLKIEGAILNSSLVFIIDDSLMYQIDLAGKIDQTTGIAFTSAPVISQNEYGIIIEETKLVPTTNMEIYMKTYNHWYNWYNNTDNYIKVFDDPAILDDPEFINKSSIKASDGCEFYNAKTVNETISIPIFSGLPLLSKGDKIALKIFTENLNSMGDEKLRIFYAKYPKEYIIHYNIFKKKINTFCNVYFKILNLNRPLRY